VQLKLTEGLRGALRRVNAGRLGLTAGVADDVAEVEREIEAIYRPSVRLAIYGTLAPGKVNHHHIADLGGDWYDAALRGGLGKVPEGVHQGLPGLRLDPAAPAMAVKLLVCPGLPVAWARLDAFEGEEMQRLLVPLESADGPIAVANVYALRRAMIEMLG
jgi:gamma-glutamylcyclotransferase (GGCT)/AIG2-like uncharacterized protein YtfP